LIQNYQPQKFFPQKRKTFAVRPNRKTFFHKHFLPFPSPTHYRWPKEYHNYGFYYFWIFDDESDYNTCCFTHNLCNLLLVLESKIIGIVYRQVCFNIPSDIQENATFDLIQFVNP